MDKKTVNDATFFFVSFVTISNILFTFRAWFHRSILQEEKMSKVKEKVMEEEMKENREVEKEGRVRKKKMPLPGSFENPFRCGQGLNCPWVNGEKGRRCVLWHPLPALRCNAILGNTAKHKTSAMKAGGMENEDGMVEQVQKEETEFVKEKVIVKNEEKKLDRGIPGVVM